MTGPQTHRPVVLWRHSQWSGHSGRSALTFGAGRATPQLGGPFACWHMDRLSSHRQINSPATLSEPTLCDSGNSGICTTLRKLCIMNTRKHPDTTVVGISIIILISLEIYKRVMPMDNGRIGVCSRCHINFYTFIIARTLLHSRCPDRFGRKCLFRGYKWK